MPSDRSGFNPRARDGREMPLLKITPKLKVSIHAPVMDAKKDEVPSLYWAGFNPRARDGREDL